MAGPFATIADLEEIWRTLDAADKTKAERLLAAARRRSALVLSAASSVRQISSRSAMVAKGPAMVTPP